MTGLGRASVFLPILASDYAILMLINGQLTDFCVTARFSAIASPRGRAVRAARSTGEAANSSGPELVSLTSAP